MAEFKFGDLGKFMGLGLKLIPLISVAIATAEAVTGATGEQKKAAVLTAIKAGLPILEEALGKDVANDPALLEAASHYIDAFVALQNAAAASARVKVQPS